MLLQLYLAYLVFAVTIFLVSFFPRNPFNSIILSFFSAVLWLTLITMTPTLQLPHFYTYVNANNETVAAYMLHSYVPEEFWVAWLYFAFAITSLVNGFLKIFQLYTKT